MGISTWLLGLAKGTVVNLSTQIFFLSIVPFIKMEIYSFNLPRTKITSLAFSEAFSF